MFDALVAPPPRRRTVRAVIAGFAIAVHAAALTGLVIAGMWRIERLERDTPSGVRATFALPGDPGGGGAPRREKLVAKKEEPRRVKARDLVQPRRDAEPVSDATADADPDAGDGDADADGPPGNGTGGDGTGFDVPTGTGCTQPPCGGGDGKDPRTPPPRKVEAKVEPVTIAPDIAAGLRISGNDRIAAPDAVRVQMVREGKERVVGTVKLCIGADGRVASATLLRSTGYEAYDALLLREMRAWRYRPYTVDGRAAPACTAVTLVYVMKK